MKTRFILLIILLLCPLLGHTIDLPKKLTPIEDKKETLGPKNGTLLIIGGAAREIFYEKFMELIGGPDKPIIVKIRANI